MFGISVSCAVLLVFYFFIFLRNLSIEFDEKRQKALGSVLICWSLMINNVVKAFIITYPVQI